LPPEPKVGRVASEEEEEEEEQEDLARESIRSCEVMIQELEEQGLDMSVPKRQLTLAHGFMRAAQPDKALSYANKAMEEAEAMESKDEGCPKCHAEIKPEWVLCPKCGELLR
jgi:hypothetical protein